MITALIPARSGSKRVPHKNIRLLNNKPLLTYSIRTALACPSIDRVVVSTNDSEYKKIAMASGADVITRPEEYCMDTSTDYAVVKHFLERNIDPLKGIVYLRPTTPIRKVEVVEDAISSFLNSCHSSLRSVEEMSESAYKCFEISKLNNLKGICCTPLEYTNKPNQQCTKTYKPNGYVDIIDPAIASVFTLFGKNIMGYVTERVTEVDTEEDFEYLEYQLRGELYVYD